MNEDSNSKQGKCKRKPQDFDVDLTAESGSAAVKKLKQKSIEDFFTPKNPSTRLIRNKRPRSDLHYPKLPLFEADNSDENPPSDYLTISRQSFEKKSTMDFGDKSDLKPDPCTDDETISSLCEDLLQAACSSSQEAMSSGAAKKSFLDQRDCGLAAIRSFGAKSLAALAENTLLTPSDQHCVLFSNGEVVPRWELIESSLKYAHKWQNFDDIRNAILRYNWIHARPWSFNGLRKFLTTFVADEMRQKIFSEILPRMARAALELPENVTQVCLEIHVPAFYSVWDCAQVLSLLCAAFFCCYPQRNAPKHRSNMPVINFSGLFNVTHPSAMHKLQCLFNYFERATLDVPTGTLTFIRQQYGQNVKKLDFDKCQDFICDGNDATFYVDSGCKIEDCAQFATMVDFANRYIGGGVLSAGCVQEEILFCIFPELLASCLFTEPLQNDDSLVVIGAERFSAYSGYADKLQFNGNFPDTSARDKYGRRLNRFCCIDAMSFRRGVNPLEQYSNGSVRREIVKAFTGFSAGCNGETNDNDSMVICTGNWGCGAFGGDKYLKSLIQTIAAAAAKSKLIYTTFGDKHFAQHLSEMFEWLKTEKVTVARLYNALCSINDPQQNTGLKTGYDLFKEIRKHLETRHPSADLWPSFETMPIPELKN